jgi:hypothetical protein
LGGGQLLLGGGLLLLGGGLPRGLTYVRH